MKTSHEFIHYQKWKCVPKIRQIYLCALVLPPAQEPVPEEFLLLWPEFGFWPPGAGEPAWLRIGKEEPINKDDVKPLFSLLLLLSWLFSWEGPSIKDVCKHKAPWTCKALVEPPSISINICILCGLALTTCFLRDFVWVSDYCPQPVHNMRAVLFSKAC